LVHANSGTGCSGDRGTLFRRDVDLAVPITLGASLKWCDKRLFRMYIWNTAWSIASLYVLFGAYQGWYNNCASWSAYFSRGARNAFIDLNMMGTIEKHIFTFYLPMTAISLVIQLVIAGSVIWINWEVMRFTVWSDKENREFLNQHQKVDVFGEVIIATREETESREEEELLKRGFISSTRELPRGPYGERRLSVEELM